MRFLIWGSLLLFASRAWSQQLPKRLFHEFRSYSQEEAISITTSALLKNPNVSLLLKNSEGWAWNQIEKTGLEKELVRVGATVVAPVIYGKVSTRGLNMPWSPWKGAIVRPDLDYYFTRFEYKVQVSLDWRF